MKTVIICCLMALICLNASGQKKEINLQGAWKLSVYQEIEENRVVTYYPGIYKGEQIKIWSRDRIIFVNRNTDGTNTNNWFGSGTFNLKGNKYEEFYTIHCFPHLENKVLRLKVEMKNDTLIQTYFLNEKFEMDEKSTHIEKYLKIN